MSNVGCRMSVTPRFLVVPYLTVTSVNGSEERLPWREAVSLRGEDSRRERESGKGRRKKVVRGRKEASEEEVAGEGLGTECACMGSKNEAWLQSILKTVCVALKGDKRVCDHRRTAVKAGIG
eukprot:750861-Hanusia_phi.AAC.4